MSSSLDPLTPHGRRRGEARRRFASRPGLLRRPPAAPHEAGTDHLAWPAPLAARRRIVENVAHLGERA
jgi:hypothetical protein